MAVIAAPICPDPYRLTCIGSLLLYAHTESFIVNDQCPHKLPTFAWWYGNLSFRRALTFGVHQVDEMLYCFLRSQACRLLLAADYAASGGREDNLPETPAPLYVGVSAWSGTAAVFAGHLLALLTGAHLPRNRTECDALADPVCL